MSDPRIKNIPVVNKEPVKEEAKEVQEIEAPIEKENTSQSDPNGKQEENEIEEHSQFSEFSNPEENDEQNNTGQIIPQAQTKQVETPQFASGGKRTHEEMVNIEVPSLNDDLASHNANFHINSAPDDQGNHGDGQTSKADLKNGCCRKCMKAFSENRKSCLCQVPKHHRRSQLPATGCKF